jgi:hypothetical protein
VALADPDPDVHAVAETRRRHLSEQFASDPAPSPGQFRSRLIILLDQAIDAQRRSHSSDAEMPVPDS